MEKSDLRSGMRVKCRNGEMMTVLLNSKSKYVEGNLLSDGEIWSDLKDYTGDLTNKVYKDFDMNKEHDIMEVWLARSVTDMLKFSLENFNCIWKREKRQYITKKRAEEIIHFETGEKVKIKMSSTEEE